MCKAEIEEPIDLGIPRLARMAACSDPQGFSYPKDPVVQAGARALAESGKRLVVSTALLDEQGRFRLLCYNSKNGVQMIGGCAFLGGSSLVPYTITIAEVAGMSGKAYVYVAEPL